MKFRGTKISKRTMALLAAALILLGSGSVMGTKAAINVTGDKYDAQIVTDSISVAITDNEGNEDTDGKIFDSMDGKAEPGWTYNESVGVMNNGDADEYVRVVVRKYWTKPDGSPAEETSEETSDAQANAEKDLALDPAMIELGVAGDWNAVEGNSPETTIYYLKNPLKKNDEKLLFSSVRVDKSVATARKIFHDGTEISEDEVKDVTSGTITYEYKYNGYSMHVEAEAQAVQTHNSKEAIKSIWGVDPSDVGINVVD